MSQKLKDTCASDPFDISGTFHTVGYDIVVQLQTNNPTTQDRVGQLFLEKQTIMNGKSFNQNIACMLRRLADSVEFNWENTAERTNRTNQQ